MTPPFCAIWHHLYNLKHVKNTRVQLLVKLQIEASNKLLDERFSEFLNCPHGTKSRKAPQIIP